MLFERIPLYTLYGELILDLNTAIYKQGEIIQDRRVILKSYLQNKFWVNIGLLLVYSLSQAYGAVYLQILMLVRVKQVLFICSKLEDRFRLRKRIGPQLVDIVALFFYLLVFAHVISCTWHFIGVNELNSYPSVGWLEDYQHESW